MQRTASYRHFYHSAFVYCSSQTLLNRKEINRKEVNTGIIQGIQCVLISKQQIVEDPTTLFLY